MSIPTPPPSDTSELADLILRTARRLRAAHADALAGSPLNPHQAHALRAIHRLAPARPSAIAGRLHVARGSATEVIDTLVAGGWAARTPDPSDGRATLLSLTASGEALLTQVAAARARGAEGVLGDMPPGDRATTLAALSRLINNPAHRGGAGTQG